MIRNLIYQFIAFACLVVGAVALDISGVTSNWVWAGVVACWISLTLWMIGTEAAITNLKPLRYRLLSKLLLANGRRLTIKLLELSMNTPYTHLEGYMLRWWLLKHPATAEEKGYGTIRNGLLYLLPFYARFQHILRADKGYHLHDHPTDFVSIITRGWYKELQQMPDGSLQCFIYKEGDINIVKRGEFHHICEVSEGGVLTLMIHGLKKYDSWGFLVNGERIHWRTYLGLNKAPVNIFEENT